MEGNNRNTSLRVKNINRISHGRLDSIKLTVHLNSYSLERSLCRVMSALASRCRDRALDYINKLSRSLYKLLFSSVYYRRCDLRRESLLTVSVNNALTLYCLLASVITAVLLDKNDTLVNLKVKLSL